ncbi:phosphoadenosine phosphosulfate reductase [Litchfieldella qijiaojingensis]|uniref:Phosphoadenosine phosphosulfate reductase n=1 Tax=Litchfieldella qijiaojingensis TaxID=980347 RepID=A0ABQ2Z9C0_9GAMM|nr:phosphoadenosine phosphosulfate reductase family protein [Halomonas qijiaojingensis]GGY07778.1 phosphoadenosine phosphosulfate reductase [Halomonas qijiaojingensis]
MATLEEALAKANDTSVKHIVSLSGGKDSTALALFMREHYPELPVEYVFCDTGVELPETDEYLERLEAVLGTEIVRLNALDKLGAKKKGNRTPFDLWLEVYGGYLPSPRSRWCTRVLKIQPFEDYVGANTAYSYIGIRHDENREGYTQQSKKPPALSDKPNILPIYPFKEHKMGLTDIQRLLEESGLGLPKYYNWRSRSGCYFCFYQQKGEWQALKRNHPDLFARAKMYENPVNGAQFTWVEGRTLEDLEKDPRQYEVKAPDEVDGCAICHL